MQPQRMLRSSKLEYNAMQPIVAMRLGCKREKVQTDSTEKSPSCAPAIIVTNRRERINLRVWNRIGDGYSIPCVIPVTLQHFLSLSRRGTLCAGLFVTLQNLMRASMFRSKFSILLSISYDETYENVAEIIGSTKELRDTAFNYLSPGHTDKSTDNELSLKHVAHNIDCDHIVFR